MKILERNIHFFTQRLLDQANTPGTVLAEGIDRYEHTILANYHRLNVYRRRSAILDRLSAIERDEQALESASEWYAVQRGLERQPAQAAVAADLLLLRSHFDAIPDLVAEIDARNARFSGVALRKLRYLLRQNRRTESLLEFILGALAHGEAPEVEFDVYRCELLSDSFLYTPPKRRPKTAPQVLAVTPGADREKVYKEAASRVQRLFARRRIEEFEYQFLGPRSSASLEELAVNGDQDYIRRLYIVGTGWTAQRHSISILIPDASTKGPTGIRQADRTGPQTRRKPRRQLMDFIEDYLKLEPGQRDHFQQVVTRLLSGAALSPGSPLRVDPDWRFAERYRDLIDSYLRLGGWRFDIDLGLRVARSVHEAGTQRVRFSKLESLVLCALCLYYHEQMRLATDQERCEEEESGQ